MWLHSCPELLLPLPRLIQHTKDLMESEEKLCIKVLRTLQQMLLKKTKSGDRVSAGWGPGGEGCKDAGAQARQYGPHSHPLSGQPAAQDAAAKLPPEPEVQLSGGPSRPHGHWSVLPVSILCPGGLFPPLLPSTPLPHWLSLKQVPLPGLDQDWSAIAATQCRLDKEGATKLVCDLITSTKNEKIFQESIGLAIRLLDGGNTEIQVQYGGLPVFHLWVPAHIWEVELMGVVTGAEGACLQVGTQGH